MEDVLDDMVTYTRAYQIRYPCASCGEVLILRPGGEDTEVAVGFLKSKGWRHSKCPRVSRS